MRRGQISVGLDAATEPSYCLGVGIELHLGEADVEQPPEGVYIARRQAKGFVDMDLGLSTATEYILWPNLYEHMRRPKSDPAPGLARIL